IRRSYTTWPEPAGQAPAAGPAPGQFDEILPRGPVRAAVSDPQWLRHLLAVESALAAATAAHGLVPPAAAAAIQAACRQIELDPAELARAAAEPGNPVLPVVPALRSADAPELARYAHLGAA